MGTVFFRDYKILAKKELHRSLQVISHAKLECADSCRLVVVVFLFFL